MSAIKTAIKSMLPGPVFRAIQKYRMREYRGLSTEQVFTKIYEDGFWGKSGDPSQRFFSGLGSHDSVIVETYVAALKNLLGSFETKPDVVDLGCGDFCVGNRVRSLCGNYIACDIVPPLIAFNQEKYESLNVDFRVLDITKDKLPKADIVFIRQVFQHLSNDQIKRALPEILSNYKYVVVTEHLPRTDPFPHNLEKPAGPDIRVDIGSGVVLTSSPFSIAVKDERTLCEVLRLGGRIRTTLYEVA